MLPTCTFDDIRLISIDDEILKIAEKMNCSDVVAAVLSSREKDGLINIENFRVGGIDESLSSLELGPGVSEAVDTWKRSVSGSSVLVYGDYDVDGIASTALAVELAGVSGASSVHYYLPHRQKEGYGVHLPLIRRALAQGVQTLIITDCGSKDVEPLREAVDGGMAVIVFDHHSVDGDTIDLPALVNPQRGGSQEARNLCATSVLWCWAAVSSIVSRRWLEERLDLVALATVADCVPMGKLNRVLVDRGLEMLRNTRRSGIKELYARLGVSTAVLDEETLAMKVIPCLNAAGRMDVADLALSIVLGTGNVAGDVDRLDALNRRRKDLSADISSAIAEKIKRDMEHVLYDDRWPVGVLSAIASRLCHSYDKGFALAAPSGSGIKGTLRVPEGANAVGILSELDDMLTAWGGHPYAAGFSVDPSRWGKLSSRLSEKLRSIVPERTVETVIEYDLSRFDMALWRDLRTIGPFGQLNPFPCFFIPRRGGERLLPLGKGEIHCKIDVGSGFLIAFNGAEQHREMDNIAGWLYRPRLNQWKGRINLQFLVEKIVLSC
ncbi:phosphoesterase RecJ domain protein [Dethiosulfovibrio peptidovorans DSM 11002]|uniref:Single-stranded-DNA-specific exonuclease RecJ n=1 Tax=Dethiosulfovibrio peptidovorans DSM 11002 TaxID=469381 RepID=D2Z8Y2_9BACT|nr:phosphoesterase RecJ domain protein [Dethiosulfovibrio peptidovorans DSM 11002]